jgi:AraC-like DNA-binding protein
MGFHEDIIRRAISFAEANLKEKIQVNDIARAANCSQFHFTRLFTKITGASPAAYLRTRRLEMAASEIMAGRDILEAAVDYRFGSQGAFTRSFKRHFRATPGTYKKSGIDIGSYVLDKLMEAEMRKQSKRLPQHLAWVPIARGDGHRLVRGIETILEYLGEEKDYDTIMGDSGQAFIMQGEENSINLIDGAVDVGWWPLEPLITIRLDFLEKTIGRKLTHVYPEVSRLEDVPGLYPERFESLVVSSIATKTPCLAWIVSSWFVVIGHDDEEPPLFGECAIEGKPAVSRIKDGWPSILITLGEPVKKIDRQEADFRALKYAIALHHDQLLGMKAEHTGEYALRNTDRFDKYWRTGLKSFSAWLQAIKNMEHMGKHFWHANVLSHLHISRSSAIRYLTAMQKRNTPAVAVPLGNAIEKYENVVKELETVDRSSEDMDSSCGREALAAQVKVIAEFECQAIEKAVKVLESARR